MRKLVQTIIDKIVIDKDKNIEIIYKFSILNNMQLTLLNLESSDT